MVILIKGQKKHVLFLFLMILGQLCLFSTESGRSIRISKLYRLNLWITMIITGNKSDIHISMNVPDEAENKAVIKTVTSQRA